MSESIRSINRAILFVLALLGFAVAVLAGWPAVTGDPLPLLALIEQVVSGWGISAAAWPAIVGAIAALILVLSLAWILTRRRRRTRSAVEEDGVRIDDGVVESLLRTSLNTAPDIVGVRAATFLRRRGTARLVRVSVQLRPRADLGAALERIQRAVADLDTQLGRPLPFVLHVTTGLRTAFAHDRRVD
jgi:hypothetical protein